MKKNNLLGKSKLILRNIKDTMKILFRYEKKYIFLLLFFNVCLSILPFLSIVISQQMLNMLQIGGTVRNLIYILILYSSIKLVFEYPQTTGQ